MAFEVGQFNEFDDANSVADASILVAASAIKMGNYKSAFYQSMAAPLVTQGLNTVDFEVFSRSKTTKGGTVDGEWNATDLVDLGLDATSIKGLTVGSILEMVTGEFVIVKSVDRTAVTIDVYARGAGGTTGAVQATSSDYVVRGFAGKDEELKNVESYRESTGKYTNYVQMVIETIDWTKRGAELKRMGLDGDKILPILIEEATLRVAEMLGVMAIHGLPQLGVDGGTPYMSAGLFSQLADNAGGSRPILNYNASGALTEEKLRLQLSELTNTGVPDTIWLSAANKEVVNDFKGTITQTRQDTVAGSYVDTYNYEGLMLNFRVDSDMPDSKIAVVTSSSCKKKWVEGDGLRLEDEPKASSREFRQSIQGSLGFAIEDVGYAHSYMYGVTV